MLQFIIGTAGTGKTTAMMEQLGDWVRGGGSAVLLVPEQLSFESEKRLYRELGPRLALSVEVLSFTRLCNGVFRAFGGLANPSVSQAAKYLLMSLALGEVRDSLTVYKKSLSNTAFLQTMSDTCGEFKTAGVPPEKLAETARKCEGPLTDKLNDLSRIYGAYQALLDRGYTDGDDDLIRACALLENNDYFGGCAVFVDGFTTFMAAEFELLGHAIRQSPRVVFAMTCDSLTDRQGGMGVFSPVKTAISRLIRIAEQAGVPVSVPVRCGEARRFQGKLEHIGLHFMQPGAPAYRGAGSDAVRLFRAADRYEEAAYVAASIAALARDEGMRYRDIAVVARDTGPYLRALEAAFARYGIPWFTDRPIPVENHPLVTGLLHAVDAARSGFDTESVLLLAKSPLLGLDVEKVSRLDNYCYLWGIRGAAWSESFASNPRGLAGPLTEEDAALLEELNQARLALTEPLKRLREALDTGTGTGFATGLYRFLQEIRAADNLTGYADGLPLEERNTFLSESAQIWDIIIDILDVFGAVMGKVRVQRARLCELLRLVLGTAEIGLPPQTLDQVLVGMANRIRPVDLKAVFVIGAVEGEFPAQTGPIGVFTDAERQQMIAAGVEVVAPTLQRTVLEKFFVYYALTLASESLTVSWPGADLAGQELLPSEIVSRLQSLFPWLEPEKPDPVRFLAGEKPTLELLASALGRGTELEATLLEYISGGDENDTLFRMERARWHTPHQIEDTRLARSLFGNRLRLSPTRVERYYRCPFTYFAADGLGLRARGKVEFTPLESGSVIHHVLQVMVRRHGGEGLAELGKTRMEDEIAAVIREYLAARVEDIERLPARFRHLFGRLTGMLARLLRHIGKEFSQSEFRPAAFELPISAEEGVEPLRLVTADGVSVMVEGVVDRVDVMEKGGRRYVRVVDYKSGAKSFDLHDILYGLNMQMLLYLFTIRENGKGPLEDAIPAGVLYMPVRESFVSAGREEDEGKIKAGLEKQWRMSGLLLEDEEVLRGMERDLAGVFIPAKLTKSGDFDRYSSLAGKAEMGRLSRKVRELVSQMASSLSSGEVGARPVLGCGYNACEYCDYRALCGFEAGDPVRQIADLDREAVFQLLEKEEYDV